MKVTRKVLVAALDAASLIATASAFAAMHGGHYSGGGHWGGGHSGGGHWGGGHWSGGHWGGHHGYWGSHWSFYLGVPIAGWGWPYYYGYYPYYYDYWYPYSRETIVYGDAQPVPYEQPETTQVQPGPGAPTQEPAYRNYCESAKAYYPKVTQCPGGWKFIPAY